MRSFVSRLALIVLLVTGCVLPATAQHPRCLAVMRIAPACWPSEGGTPSSPAFDSKIFLRKDFDSNRDTESIRIGYIEGRRGQRGCSRRFGVVSTNPERVPPPPPPFDSKIFHRNGLDSNRDTELIRIGYIEGRMDPETCVHVLCTDALFVSHAAAEWLQVRSGVRDTTLGAVWLFFNYTGGVKESRWKRGRNWCARGAMVRPDGGEILRQHTRVSKARCGAPAEGSRIGAQASEAERAVMQ